MSLQQLSSACRIAPSRGCCGAEAPTCPAFSEIALAAVGGWLGFWRLMIAPFQIGSVVVNCLHLGANTPDAFPSLKSSSTVA